MNMSGYTEKGFKRKLAVQALFGKIFYLSEVGRMNSRLCKTPEFQFRFHHSSLHVSIMHDTLSLDLSIYFDFSLKEKGFKTILVSKLLSFFFCFGP